MPLSRTASRPLNPTVSMCHRCCYNTVDVPSLLLPSTAAGRQCAIDNPGRDGPPMNAGDRGTRDPGGGEAVGAVLAALDAGEPPPRPELRTAVRHLLGLLAARAPGRAVEVRVPPYAAVQCVSGPRHTR